MCTNSSVRLDSDIPVRRTLPLLYQFKLSPSLSLVLSPHLHNSFERRCVHSLLRFLFLPDLFLDYVRIIGHSLRTENFPLLGRLRRLGCLLLRQYFLVEEICIDLCTCIRNRFLLIYRTLVVNWGGPSPCFNWLVVGVVGVVNRSGWEVLWRNGLADVFFLGDGELSVLPFAAYFGA